MRNGSTSRSSSESEQVAPSWTSQGAADEAGSSDFCAPHSTCTDLLGCEYIRESGSTLQELQKRLARCSEEVQEQQQIIAQLQDERRIYKEAMHEQQVQSGEIVRELEHKWKQSQAAVDSANENIRSLETSNRQLVEQHRSQCDAMKQEIVALTNEREHMEGKQYDLNTKVLKLVEENSELQERLQAHDKDVRQQLRPSLEGAAFGASDCSRIHEELDEARGENRSLRQRVVELKEEKKTILSKSKQMMTDMQNRVASCECHRIRELSVKLGIEAMTVGEILEILEATSLENSEGNYSDSNNIRNRKEVHSSSQGMDTKLTTFSEEESARGGTQLCQDANGHISIKGGYKSSDVVAVEAREASKKLAVVRHHPVEVADEKGTYRQDVETTSLANVVEENQRLLTQLSEMKEHQNKIIQKAREKVTVITSEKEDVTKRATEQMKTIEQLTSQLDDLMMKARTQEDTAATTKDQDRCTKLADLHSHVVLVSVEVGSNVWCCISSKDTPAWTMMDGPSSSLQIGAGGHEEHEQDQVMWIRAIELPPDTRIPNTLQEDARTAVKAAADAGQVLYQEKEKLRRELGDITRRFEDYRERSTAVLRQSATMQQDLAERDNQLALTLRRAEKQEADLEAVQASLFERERDLEYCQRELQIQKTLGSQLEGSLAAIKLQLEAEKRKVSQLQDKSVPLEVPVDQMELENERRKMWEDQISAYSTKVIQLQEELRQATATQRINEAQIERLRKRVATATTASLQLDETRSGEVTSTGVLPEDMTVGTREHPIQKDEDGDEAPQPLVLSVSVQKLRGEIRSLETQLEETTQEKILLGNQLKLLKEELRKAEAISRVQQQGGALNTEYLRNTVMRFLETDLPGPSEHESLVPVLCTLLSISAEEVSKIQEKRQERRGLAGRVGEYLGL